MKKISELGLELIELKDQILLVEKINGTCGKWILVDWDEYGYFVDTTEHDRDYGGKDKNVIASTVQLQGLPLLVIEDEINKIAKECVDQDILAGESDDYFNGKYSGFKKGYNKAKETYKFTEEDLRKAMEYQRQISRQMFDYGTTSLSTEKFIESLTKKELWIEVEYQDMMGMWISSPTILEHCDRPTRVKITNNQIKAIWK